MIGWMDIHVRVVCYIKTNEDIGERVEKREGETKMKAAQVA